MSLNVQRRQYLDHSYSFSCRKRYHRGDKDALNTTGIQKSSGRPNNPKNRTIGDNADSTVYKSSTASNTSLLKRRVIYFILAVCITLSKSSLATTETEINSQTLNDSDNSNCTKEAILHEFPSFMTKQERTHGGIILHVIIATYLIFALGGICDDYFVPVLEIICETLNLSNDVAGATFMAAGTSAPEFFTNIMGTFVTKSDLGIGTIVGSAVFNIFGVISVCGLFAGRKIPLDWYPITRDCVVYGITVLLLIIVLLDEKVYWWESIILITFYIIYIIIMFCNTRIERWAFSTQRKVKKRITNQTLPNESTPLHSAADKGVQSNVSGGKDALPTVAITSASMEFMSDGTQNDKHAITITGNDYRHMLQPQTSATPSNISEQTMATDTTIGSDANLLPNKNGIELPTTDTPDVDDAGVEEISINQTEPLPSANISDHDQNHITHNHEADVEASQDNDTDEEAEVVKYPWERPDGGIFAHVWWILFFPMQLLFFLTIPDVRRLPRKKSRRSLTTQPEKCCDRTIRITLISLCFILSIGWIGAISYVVTWMITVIGSTIGVPDVVMGLSFLAIGTSIPELISSYIVTKQGKGSMAVSNSIGSNTFDILVCLGIPWMIRAIQRGISMAKTSENPKYFVDVKSDSLVYTVVTLLASLAILYAIFLRSHWVLNRFVGFACLLIYSVLLAISLAIEILNAKTPCTKAND